MMKPVSGGVAGVVAAGGSAVGDCVPPMQGSLSASPGTSMDTLSPSRSWLA
jgi:hypothetical protein